MKKIYVKLVIGFALLISIIFINNKVQAASASISANNTQPKEGETITVTASVSAGAWNLRLSGNGKTETIYGVTSDGNNNQDSKSITFTAGAPGTKYEFSLTGGMTDASSDEEESVNKSILIEVAQNISDQQPSTPSVPDPQPIPDPEPQTPSTPVPEPVVTKSNNANLSNLGIKPNDFTGFKANKTSYDVEVPNDVDKVEVYASKAKGQDKQTITGNGTKKLEVGKNTVVVTVVAEDGTTKKEYTLNITRLEAEEKESEENTNMEDVFGLQQLEIEGIQLNPEFKTDIYEYKINLREDKEKLDIETIPTTNNVNIQITGNENLKEGENTITILVEDDNTQKVITYQITVNKVLPIEQIAQTKSNKIMDKQVFILVAIAIVIVVLIAVLIIKHIRQNKGVYGQVPFSGLNEDEDEDFYNDEDEDEEYDQYDDSEFDNVDTEDEEEEEEEEFEEYMQRRNKLSKGKRFR